MGREPELSEEQILGLIRNGQRPVWTARQLAERAGVARPTAHRRLKQLAEDGAVETVQVGNATAYYLPGIETKPRDEDPIRWELRRAFEDRFVGMENAPSTAIPAGHPGEAGPGDKVQLEVGSIEPGEWAIRGRHAYENRRDRPEWVGPTVGRHQALISGELYAKPTVPIEHVEYPDDWDLELNIGARYEEVGDREILVVAGQQNYLVKPCDEAVFLQDVEIEWFSEDEDGDELDMDKITFDASPPSSYYEYAVNKEEDPQ